MIEYLKKIKTSNAKAIWSLYLKKINSNLLALREINYFMHLFLSSYLNIYFQNVLVTFLWMFLCEGRATIKKPVVPFLSSLSIIHKQSHSGPYKLARNPQ